MNKEIDFGNHIKFLRKKSGMTQVQLAEKVGVSKGTVAMWEVNKREASFEMLIKLSKLFDVSIDFLIRGYEFKEDFLYE